MSALTIKQVEKLEFDLVAAIAVFTGEPSMREKATALLAKLRDIKRKLLAAAPDVLRKSAARPPLAGPRWVGLPCVETEVTELVKAARDRQSEERHLGKASGRTRYQAPKHLRGRPLHLADGRQLNIPEHGFCELTDCAAHPASPHAQSARHAELIAAGFRVLPDEPDEALKRTLREQAIVGDRGLIAFLNRNAAR